ncbi:D-alanine--D-alanine ligase family protein [Luteimicrobium subarcticum]|uniref:D-alanine--D-alanine ligase n=1 Tax=Luteimicrobium subarcticum TaxID=620910 RepID=A0A2M8WJK6_9MICO|nr:D-alanine--D-alanine ligase [Luteimicrobium subarcticum]PJI91078.1 D-alanine-D-alanine ligase [Luteimicrobium subarcticum]
MTSTGPHIVILAGGLSHERDVSIRSGRRVADALRGAGCEVVVRDVDASLLGRLADDRPDVVWPLLHGATGEDGSIHDILELLGLPVVGSDPRASRVAWNKAIAKSIVLGAGLPSPDYVTLQQSVFRELGAGSVLQGLSRSLGMPVVVKPNRGGSALGVTLTTDADELPHALVHAFSYGDVALVERAVTGTEIGVSVIETDEGPVALPGVEVVTDGPYDYDARYNPGRAEYFTPARISDELRGEVDRVAVAAFRALGLRDLARVDLIVDGDDVPQFLEVNVSPGMTETSLFPQAVTASGSSLGEAYRGIAERAFRRGPRRHVSA